MHVVWSDKASSERFGQIDFIAIRSPLAALLVDERVKAQVRQLESFPFVGRPGKVRLTRELVTRKTSFVVVYRVENDRVFIVRFLHAKQQWPPRRRSRR